MTIHRSRRAPAYRQPVHFARAGVPVSTLHGAMRLIGTGKTRR